MTNACLEESGILPFHTVVRLSEEVLVQFKGGGPVPVQPHCIPCTLPQLVSHRCGYEGNGQSIHLFIDLSKQTRQILLDIDFVNAPNVEGYATDQLSWC